jgi:hypothetical protein
MAEDLIRYDILAQDALRGVVRKVLSEVARTGLPGEHHFKISFQTTAPGVRISTRLLAKYPEEMTIVLQHQYRELEVTEQAFEVGLHFGGVPERIFVPFNAVTAFGDPAVGFQLQFAPVVAPVAVQPAEPPALAPKGEASPPIALVPAAREKTAPTDAGEKPDAETAPAAQVLSLDAFRKK